MDCKRETALALTGWRRLFQPDLVVVEGSTTDRRNSLGAGQRIDALAADMVAVGMDRFGNQHAAADAKVLDSEVVDIMEAPFPSVSVEDSVRDAVELLAGDRGALTVLDHGRPVGIVTRSDLLESLAR